MLAVCEKHGWTYAQFYALPEGERIDHLAYRYRRQQFLDGLMQSFHKRIEEDKGIEQTALILTLIERYAA